jgi:hypothetical protein
MKKNKNLCGFIKTEEKGWNIPQNVCIVRESKMGLKLHARSIFASELLNEFMRSTVENILGCLLMFGILQY